jgi:transketolase
MNSRPFGPRRAIWETVSAPDSIDPATLAMVERYDLIYRSLVAIMFNFTQSGHPGGSVSSGRIITSLLLDTMDYDLGDPNRRDNDLLSYAAGHKALGLYATLALRDEMVRQARPALLPANPALRLRLEDALGFRRNPTHPMPLFRAFGSKPLDGHPTPATPFVKLATGPSGIGVGSSMGLALAAADVFGADAPRVHVIEGEGGLTPGRVVEAMAFASAAGLSNAFLHVDWNQSSIDSDAVTREGGRPGDYVQWDPMELLFLHDWNVIEVADGFDIGLVLTAQRRAALLDNGQPTGIVYRTTKGWRYGIEGKKSHGGGHKMFADAYFAALEPLFGGETATLPKCDPADPVAVEQAYWDTLLRVRALLEGDDVTRATADAVARVTSTGGAAPYAPGHRRSRGCIGISILPCPRRDWRSVRGPRSRFASNSARCWAISTRHPGVECSSPPPTSSDPPPSPTPRPASPEGSITGGRMPAPAPCRSASAKTGSWA